MKTEVSFTYPDCFACAVSKTFGTRVRFVRRDIKRGEVHEEVEIYNEEKEKLEQTIEYLSSYPHVTECRLAEKSRSGNIARLAISMKEGTCPIDLLLKDFSMSSRRPFFERVDYNGRIHWRLEAKGNRKLQRLEKALKTKYQVQDFLAKRQASTTSMTKSNFLLKEAFERGYFDVPKGTSIEELSRDLNIPLSTLDIDIRRALKNVLLESTC